MFDTRAQVLLFGTHHRSLIFLRATKRDPIGGHLDEFDWLIVLQRHWLALLGFSGHPKSDKNYFARFRSGKKQCLGVLIIAVDPCTSVGGSQW